MLMTVCASAQISEYRKLIDSIGQKKWSETNLDLDSLANPKIEGFKRKFADTIYIPKNAVVPNGPTEMPLTPFGLVKYKDPQRWYFMGQNNLVFNQASFSNWNAGGNSNIGVIAKVNYNMSYKKNKHFLENIFQFGFGFVTTNGQPTKKTDDYINVTSNYGYDIGKNYYLSSGIQFVTQFGPGYNYSSTPDPKFEDRISKFMAPGYLNVGLGISYNPNENLQIIFRPLNGRFTFVTDPLLQKAGKYGVLEDGQSLRTELGFRMNFIYRLNIHKGIYMDNQLNLFSNYLEHMERVNVAYNASLNIKFNKYITTVVNLDLLYDHYQIQKLQTKQTLGIGFIYNLGGQNIEKDNRKKVIKPIVTK